MFMLHIYVFILGILQKQLIQQASHIQVNPSAFQQNVTKQAKTLVFKPIFSPDGIYVTIPNKRGTDSSLLLFLFTTCHLCKLGKSGRAQQTETTQPS